MYHLFLGIQYFETLLLFFLLIYTLFQKTSRKQQLLLILTISALINSVGYLKELKATSLDTALDANMFSYFGKVFIILSMFLFILNYCRIKHSRTFTIFLILIHTTVLALVLTCKYNSLIYTDIRFSYSGFYPHLEMSHGIVYYLYCAVSFSYLVIIQLACIKRFRETNNHLQRVQLEHFMYIAIITIIGFVCYQTGLTKFYDSTAVSYTIAALIIIMSTFCFNLLHTEEIAKENVIDNLNNGIIILDNAEEVLYMNQTASSIYPSLSSDFSADSNAYSIDRLKQYEHNHEHLFIGDDVYSISKKSIKNNNKIIGTTYYLINITNDYNYTNLLEMDVYTKNRKIQFIQHALITSFANMVEARDGLTGMHTKRTSEYVRIIASYLSENNKYTNDFSNTQIEDIINAAPLHDIGKIAIPDAILKKPGPLTSDEFEIIKTHSETGAKLIEELLSEIHDDNCLSIAHDMAFYHHERWDGNGYPCHLQGDEIPLCARIMSVADVYDALRSKRCYKERIPANEAYNIIMNGSGTQFDPVIVHAFASVFDQIQAVD